MIENRIDIISILREQDNSDISKYDKSFLDKTIQNRMIETQNLSCKEYYNFLKKDSNERKHLLKSLQISYSEFFRNPLTFAVLERVILPSLFSKKKNSNQKEIRVWSAASAGGQEAYSLAILLEELTDRTQNDVTYRIFATDQSEEQVKEAEKGKYPSSTLKKINLKRVEEWFTKQGDNYTVIPKLKEKIDFSVFNLFETKNCCPPDSIYGDFDLIFCANLLFYYENEYQNKILDKSSNCLSKDGFLVSDESEREILINHNFHEVFSPSAIFQKIRKT